MQTNFTAEQLRDPDTATSNQVLRSCVHCGLWTATCPTFLLLGDELDSPRGRIYLIKDMLETGRPATEDVVRHVDRCLSCLACMTTCPSGVNYMHLVDHARSYIEQTYRRPVARTGVARRVGHRAAAAGTVPHGVARRASGAAVRAAGPGSGTFGRRLQAMLDLVPDRLPSPSSMGHVHRAQGERRARVALLAGCAQQVLAPQINEATIRLLTRIGVEVIVAEGAGCCGALTHHMGQHKSAMASARANIAAWSREIEGEGLDAIVINASGCGTTVKDYGFMFRSEPEPWRSNAEKVSALACDISEFVSRLDYAPARGRPALTVAYHSACSLQHGQQVTAEPKSLLQRAGFTVVEPAEPHICCGSAGTYNMLQPEIATRLRDRKLGNLRATDADLIAAGNIGCITQLAGHGIPVVHTVELLDWMSGGPAPSCLRASNAR